MKKISNRLKIVRENQKMSATEFAKLLNLQQRTYASYERDERKPPLEVLEQIVEKYNVSSYWLLTGKGEPFLTNQPLSIDDDVLRIKVRKNQKLLIEYEDS